MNKKLAAAMLALVITGTGCSGFNGSAGSQDYTTRNAAVTQYSADSLRNYVTARDFAAQGRFELAREHYLLALAAANDPYLQDALAHELESVNMMIKSLR